MQPVGAEFSLNPLFHRQWSSVYEALQDCRPDRKKLMMLYQEELEQQVSATEHIPLFCHSRQEKREHNTYAMSINTRGIATPSLVHN
jgi:hypothetical protein